MAERERGGAGGRGAKCRRRKHLGQMSRMPGNRLSQGGRAQSQRLPQVRIPSSPDRRAAPAITVDRGTWRELFADLAAGDPLEFHDSKPYPERLEQARRASGRNDAVVTGLAIAGVGKIEAVRWRSP